MKHLQNICKNVLVFYFTISKTFCKCFTLKHLFLRMFLHVEHMLKTEGAFAKMFQRRLHVK